MLGITEPAIFVNLRYVKPSATLGRCRWLDCIYVNLAGTGFGITIIPGTLHLNGQLKYVFMAVFTTALSFGLTYMFGYEDSLTVPAEDKEAEAIIEEETTEFLPASLQDERHSSDRWSSCCFV